MKIKEVNRTANIAWSPKEQFPVYLAAGTAAQQLDASFSTTAALEIYHVEFGVHDLDMPIVGTLDAEHRFHKLQWSNFGISSADHPSGLIIGGTDNGEICVLDAHSILSGDNGLSNVHTLKDHIGPVHALDINKFQSNLFASGSSDSEIFIWDLKNLETPLTPGAKTTPPDQISCLSWNNQVQHILASSSQSGRVVVWDLRKSEPIIKVGDQSAMFHYKSIAWHPDVATQMLIGNEDDRYPVIQLWDLRFASSPMKVFEGHSRGVLSLAWCPQDSDLLMSCGKDNRVLCWNPNSQAPNGEIIYEVPTNAQWTSDVRWCPRNPGIIATSSFDRHVSISTLMGGSQQVEQQHQQNQISDSFGIQQNEFAMPPSQQKTTMVVEPLKKPPKWMRRPCGVQFAFGGKLISFGNSKDPNTPKQVHISQVVTESEFLNRSHELENCLVSGQLVEFCDRKIASEGDLNEKHLWQFLKSTFDSEPRIQFLNLLGYNPEELAQKISTFTKSCGSNDIIGVNATELASKIEKLKTSTEESVDDNFFGSNGASPGQKTPPGSHSESSTLFDAIAAASSDINGGSEMEIPEKFNISTTDDADGLICQAVLTGNIEAAVDVCFKENRLADGILLAYAGGPDLLLKTQKRYFEQAPNPVSKVIAAVVNHDWRSIVELCNIENWKESLSTLVTYSKAEEFSKLSCILGGRLETEVCDYNSALICYICAGDVEKMVSCWILSITEEEHSPLVLQNLIEKVMVLRKSLERQCYQPPNVESLHMSQQLSKYAQLLSSQGNLQTAMLYLSAVTDQAVEVLKDRIYKADGNFHGSPPAFPFNKVEVQQKVSTPTYGQQPQRQLQAQTNYPSYHQPPANQTMFTPANTSTMYNNPSNMTPASFSSPQPYTSPPPPSNFSPTQPAFVPQQPFPPSQPQNYPPVSYSSPNVSCPPPNNIGQPPPPQPQIFNPMSNMNHSAVPPPTFHPPQQMKPDIAPPPPGQPMSMRAAKQQPQTPPLPQNQPMNFYNPTMSDQHLNGPGGMNAPGLPSTGRTVPPGQTQIPPQPIKKVEPPVEVAKGPIPSEHMVLQETLDALVNKCKSASNNPQTKRKLDDVRRKLEILYDLLRELKISPSVLNGLHQMIQACQSNNYMVGIQIHTHMITTGNFSEISPFMPGLKTLMQIAGQLKV